MSSPKSSPDDEQPQQDRHERLTPTDIWEQVRQIEAIPKSVLPANSPERNVLVTLAKKGYGVDVDTAGPAGPDQRWYVWIDALADARQPGRDGRVSIEEWKAHCLQLVLEIIASRFHQPSQLDQQPQQHREDRQP